MPSTQRLVSHDIHSQIDTLLQNAIGLMHSMCQTTRIARTQGRSNHQSQLQIRYEL